MRVGKHQARGMEVEPIGRSAGVIGESRPAPAERPVETVAEDRKPESGKMRAHLVAKPLRDQRADQEQPTALVEELDVGCVAAVGALWRRMASAALRGALPRLAKSRERRGWRPRLGGLPPYPRVDQPHPPPTRAKGGEAALDA